MSTKTINTRIGLKYDLYANWQQVENEFKPLKGEVIFYEIPAAAGAVVQEPAILFKVGDGTKFLKDLPWGSAIAADVYAWAKQQSLLGGTYSEGTEGAAGIWEFGETNEVITKTREEVAAFVKGETANIAVKVDQVTEDNFEEIYKYAYDPENAGHVSRIGKYQTSVSTTGSGNDANWAATGDPFAMQVTNYTASHGVKLANNNFSINLKEGEGNLDVEGGLSAKVATVTYTAEGGLTIGETTGLLNKDAANAIKSYVDAKAGEATNASDVTLSSQASSESGILSTYVLSQGGEEVGRINIPKDFLVKSATIVEATADNPIEGQTSGKYIKFEINSKDSTSESDRILYLNVNDLCDVYTANNQTGYVTLAIDNNNITATAKTQLISGASGRTYGFTSYSAATEGTQYSTGKVEVVKVEGGKTYVKVIENDPDTDFVGNVYYVNSVFETNLPTERLQLNEGSAAIDVWVKLSTFEGDDVDGLATALDVKRYVADQLAANVPNVEGSNAIDVADGTNSKTVSLKLDETTVGEDTAGSGLLVTENGLRVNDTITWILSCGNANNLND